MQACSQVRANERSCEVNGFDIAAAGSAHGTTSADWRCPDMAAAPIIVSAQFGPEDFAWLNGLRRAHFPPERNRLDAHLTLFHHLPPSCEDELRQRLTALTRRPPPAAIVDGPMNLGRGVAIRIRSPGLTALRGELAEAFGGTLTPQDAQSWRPHVTIQNKVEPAVARALHQAMLDDLKPRPVRISALAAWWYRGGPWEPLYTHSFR